MKKFLSLSLLFALALAAPGQTALEQDGATNATLPTLVETPAVPDPPTAGTGETSEPPFRTHHPLRFISHPNEFFNDFSEHGQPQPVIFSDWEMRKNETNWGDAVVIHGDATIDGYLDGNSITVLGDTAINGTVTGDVQVILGSLKLGPNANVGGQVIIVGGTVEKKEGARVRDNRINVIFGNNPVVQGLLDWLSQGLLLGRPFPPSLDWAWFIAGLGLVVNLLLMVMFPRPIEACVATMERKSVTSFFAGILGKMLAGLFVTLLCVSVVGLIVVPFMIAAYFVATLFGNITTYRYVGQQLGKTIGLGFLQSPVAALLLGSAIFYFLYMVPYLGFVAWTFAGFFGFGAVVLATYQQFRAERATPPAPIYLGTPPAPPAAPMPAPAAPEPTFAQEPATPPPAAAFRPRETELSLENVALPRAGFWLRLCATSLDAALFIITIGIFIHPRNMDREIFGLNWWNHSVVLWLAYHVFMWKTRGTTVGGIIVGLRVVRLDGRPLDYPVALIRALASVLSLFVLGLGFFWVGFKSDKQAWHDKLAGTVIVRVPRAMSLV